MEGKAMKNQEKLEYKRDLVLDAMERLLRQPNGDHASVAQIAKEAGIAKGSVYYYFNSREEIIDALITRVYSESISQCQKVLLENEINAIQKLEKILTIYVQNMTTDKLILVQYIYKEENAIIRQKTKDQNVKNIVPIISKILEQGIFEKTFECKFTYEFAEYFIALMETCFYYLLFQKDVEKNKKRLLSLEAILESSLKASQNSFNFFHVILLQYYFPISSKSK